MISWYFVFEGLLIEPSLDYSTLLKRNRKVKSINACLATKNVPQVVEFISNKQVGAIKGKKQDYVRKLYIFLSSEI